MTEKNKYYTDLVKVGDFITNDFEIIRQVASLTYADAKKCCKEVVSVTMETQGVSTNKILIGYKDSSDTIEAHMTLETFNSDGYAVIGSIVLEMS